MALHPNDLPWKPESDAAGGSTMPLQIRWLGTAGFELVCEGVTLLIDPYLTRAPLWRLLTGPIVPDRRAIRRWIDKADGIVVGHGHFDHLLDVPVIAKMTGARVWGSKTSANLLRASGVPSDQVVECAPGDVFELGPFHIELIASKHSRFAFGKVPFAGEIPCSCEIPMWGHGYRCGQMFGIAITVAGRTLYHLGSADLIDDAITTRGVDVLLLCIAARQVTDRFVPRALGRLEPELIVPTHYDNLFRSLDRHMTLLPRMEFGRFVDDVVAFDRQATISTLKVGKAITI